MRSSSRGRERPNRTRGARARLGGGRLSRTRRAVSADRGRTLRERPLRHGGSAIGWRSDCVFREDPFGYCPGCDSGVLDNRGLSERSARATFQVGASGSVPRDDGASGGDRSRDEGRGARARRRGRASPARCPRPRGRGSLARCPGPRSQRRGSAGPPREALRDEEAALPRDAAASLEEHDAHPRPRAPRCRQRREWGGEPETDARGPVAVSRAPHCRRSTVSSEGCRCASGSEARRRSAGEARGAGRQGLSSPAHRPRCHRASPGSDSDSDSGGRQRAAAARAAPGRCAAERTSS